MVSAMHNHMGTVAADVRDPCFAPVAFKPGVTCGLPSMMGVQASIMMATGLVQPLLMMDYTGFFPQDEAKELWREFSATLEKLSDEVAARNKKRYLPFTALDPRTVETGIQI